MTPSTACPSCNIRSDPPCALVRSREAVTARLFPPLDGTQVICDGTGEYNVKLLRCAAPSVPCEPWQAWLVARLSLRSRPPRPPSRRTCRELRALAAQFTALPRRLRVDQCCTGRVVGPRTPDVCKSGSIHGIQLVKIFVEGGDLHRFSIQIAAAFRSRLRFSQDTNNDSALDVCFR